MQNPSHREFELLVERYRQMMTSAAYHLCGDREAALDIVQDALIDAYRGFSGLRDIEKAGAWLYTILRRKVLDYRRKRKPADELTEDCAVYCQDETELIVRNIVIEQLLKLDDEDREILAGKYLLGLTYRELSESLGIKEGTVRIRALRAKIRLGEILRGAGVEVPKAR